MEYQHIIEYYSREDIQKALLSAGKNREVIGVFVKKAGESFDVTFTERPNMILYREDITRMAKKGVVEFHCSLERWSNPMGLKAGNYGELRTGWDLIFDLDCERTEHGKTAAEAIIWGLKKHGIESLSLKFTGGTGFHIGIPWESFPKTVNFLSAASLFPSLARITAMYVMEFVRQKFEDMLIKEYTPKELSEETGKPLEEIITGEGIDPFKIVEVDPVLIAPRHLFRMPYSLNGKTSLVSLPIKPENIKTFRKEQAEPENVKTSLGFLEGGKENEAAVLVTEALDWYEKKKEEKQPAKERREYSKKIQPDLFPPCIKHISEGLSDGRKRSVFILINFLSSMKWTQEEIEKYIEEWNRKNNPPLPDTYIRSQLRYAANKKEAIPPPNCINEAYYPSFSACFPDLICTGGTRKITIKNPVNYPYLKLKSLKRRKRQ